MVDDTHTNQQGAQGGPKAIVGGFDVHRKPNHLDYLDLETREVSPWRDPSGLPPAVERLVTPVPWQLNGHRALEGHYRLALRIRGTLGRRRAASLIELRIT